MSLLGIAVEPWEFGVVIRLSGEADLSTVGQMRDALSGQISGGARQLTIDLSGLRFADSGSIRALTDAHLALKAQGGTLELVHPQPNVARILVLLGIDQVLTVRSQPDSGTAGAGVGCWLRLTAAGRRSSGCRRVVGRSRMLDQEFGETTLRVLRETVLAHATAAGMPEGRALDVMLAVHELAANAVEHGGGTGRLRMSVTNRELICQVSDPGPASSGLPRNTPCSQRPGVTARISPWPYEPRHGLWLVCQIADHISVTCGPAGSRVTVAFAMLRSGIP